MCKKTETYPMPISCMMMYAHQVAVDSALTTKSLLDFYSSKNVDKTYTPAVIKTATLDSTQFFDTTVNLNGIHVCQARVFEYPSKAIVISGRVDITPMYTDYPTYLGRDAGYVVQNQAAVFATAGVYPIEIVGATQVGMSIEAGSANNPFAVMSTMVFLF